MKNDEALLKRYVEEKSQAAFSEFVGQRIGLVYSVSLRITQDAQRAEEVTQSVFAAAARKAPLLMNNPALVGWLFRAARFASIDVIRAVRRRTAAHEQASAASHDFQLPPREPAWEQVRPFLDDAMGRLHEHDQNAILLRFFDGEQFADIGARLGLTENAARMRVERALGKLHVNLRRRGISSTAAFLASVFSSSSFAAAPQGLESTMALPVICASRVASAGTLGQLFAESKAIAGLASLAFFGAFGMATHEFRAWQDADVRLAEVQRTILSENQQRQALTNQLHKANEQLASAQVRVKSATADFSRAFKIANPIPANAVTMPARAEEADDKRSRAIALGRYGELLPTLNLSPRKMEQFLDLTNRRTSAKSPQNYAGIAPTIAEVDVELKYLLGGPGFLLFQDYETRLPMRLMTRQLAGSLHGTAAPLTAAQRDYLMKTFGDLATSGLDEPTTWDQALDRARPLLTSSQINALVGLRREAEFDEAVEKAQEESVGP